MERWNCFPRLPFHPQVLLQLKFNLPKGNASLSFPAQSFLPSGFTLFVSASLPPSHQDSNTWSPNHSYCPRLPPFPLHQELQHPTGVSPLSTPTLQPSGTGVLWSLPSLMQVTAKTFQWSPLPSVPPASALLHHRIHLPKVLLCFSRRHRDLFDLTPCTFSQCLQLETQSDASFSISEFILSHALSRAHFFLLFL